MRRRIDRELVGPILLLAQARRFGPRIIFFDKDRGAELFIRAIGGRYDRLVGRYGTDALGTGIAIDLDELLRVAPDDEMNGLAADFLVIDSTREKRIGITLARELRRLGWRVARDIIRRDLSDSLEYARQAGVGRCLVVDRDGKKPERIRMLEPAGKEIGGFSLAELPGKIGMRGEQG